MRTLKRTVLAQRSDDLSANLHIARAIEASTRERIP